MPLLCPKSGFLLEFWDAGAISPEMGVSEPPSLCFEKVQWGTETEILVEQQPPQGVFVCDHAGLVINKFSPLRGGGPLLLGQRVYRGTSPIRKRPPP